MKKTWRLIGAALIVALTAAFFVSCSDGKSVVTETLVSSIDVNKTGDGSYYGTVTLYDDYTASFSGLINFESANEQKTPVGGTEVTMSGTWEQVSGFFARTVKFSYNNQTFEITVIAP